MSGGIEATKGVGYGSQAEQLKKAKKQNPIIDQYNQASAAVNMFRLNPALIGNILNGTAQASHQG